MHRISRSEIQKLIHIPKSNSQAVTIYMNTYGMSAHACREHLLQMLIGIRDRLTATVGYRQKHQMLAPAFSLAHDVQWWRKNDKSMAIFISSDTFNSYHLDHTVSEAARIGLDFDLLPLLNSINNKGVFYTLVLGKKVRFLWSDGRDIHDVHVPGLPQRINYSNATRGHNDIHQIAQSAQQFLAQVRTPLVVISTKDLLNDFRHLSRYQHIITKVVGREPSRLSNSQIRDKAWSVVKSYFETDEKLAKDQLKRLLKAQPSRIARGFNEVKQALRRGKVQSIFIAENAQIWAQLLNEQAQEFEEHQMHQAGDRDLVNEAVKDALAADRKVFTLNNKSLGRNKIAAILQ